MLSKSLLHRIPFWLIVTLLIPLPTMFGFEDPNDPQTLFVDPEFVGGTTFATIQEAIDAACDGSEIRVAPGKYKEILTITNKELTIVADNDSSDQPVVVDGCFMGSVVLNSNDGTPKPVMFQGFEFINGSFGAIELFDADFCLVDVIINGNFSAFEGGGIFQLGGILNVEGGCIKNNMSMSDGGGSFVSNGGIQNYNNVEFLENICNGSGAAICAVDSGNQGSVTATNTVMDNNMTMEGDAGAFLGFGVNVNFENVHIGGNDCPGVGGGAAFANCNECNINNCTIKNNSCDGAGGGLFCQDSNVCIIQSILCNNISENASGGGLYSIGGNFQCSDSNYSGNSAGMNGGGILLVDLLEGNQTIKNTCINDNIAGLNGGGAAFFGSTTSVELIKSKVKNNCADANAGGVLVDNATLKGVSTRFMANKATENGGAILGSGSSFVKCNGCIADSNWANIGGAFFVNSDSFFDVHNVNLILNIADELAGAIATAVNAELNGVNSIVYSNGVNNPIFESDPNSVNFNFSVIEGGFSGNGNTGADPQFVNEMGDDGMPGTGDENFCLSPTSSAIDAGSNADVPADLHDLDWDSDFAEPTPLDYKCNNRFVNGTGFGGAFNLGGAIVDIGAIEFQGKVVDVLLGDVNLDGAVNLLDVAPFVERLTDNVFQVEADVNQDGVVNLLDVQPFVGLLTN